jgi:endonuclease/exonuclease/phosphatase family metal-dependent hydrolase
MMKILRTLTSALLFTVAVGISAQEKETFSVVTVNIDGLPQKIWFAKVNVDGPGDAGTSRIGKYLQKKGYDIVCTQEDFNYHEVLTPWLEDDYKFDKWLGGVGIDIPGKKFDFLHLQNEDFDTDGLGACWKNNITMSNTERVLWKNKFGKFSHAADELVRKGFRRSELTLANGTRILVYNMHMDAGDLADEKEGKDGSDREARLGQWQQLKDDVLAHLDTRPIIVVGDMNSYYCRDQIKAKFIDAIAESGKGTASDVWVELAKGGEYPAPVDGIVACEDAANMLDNGEVLDKIIYINPTNGSQIKPVSVVLDMEGYKHSGKPLGDHYPLAATFEVVDRMTSGMDIDLNVPDDPSAVYYNMNGQRVGLPVNGLFIEQKGETARKRIIK